jgi:hypothetical protein
MRIITPVVAALLLLLLVEKRRVEACLVLEATA